MTKYITTLLTVFLLFSVGKGIAQAPQKWTSATIHEAMQKLDFLGSVLYFGAHPDDENTRMISYLANVRHAETAYLSLTRGDGGQNLIGAEIREELGVIRTQELLAARKIDGGQQFFSRANDFSFSKHPDETFNIWGKDAVMEDAVWVIRKFRPDIIINRFDHRTPGTTHGHHTASAIIAVESFTKSGNKHFYPEQLAFVEPWKPYRIFFNNWKYQRQPETLKKADKSKLVRLDVGVYLPKRGESATEIAARSRSQHKSQGMGTKYDRGEYLEYLELVAGEVPRDMDDLFKGINTSWTRLEGGAKVGEAVNKLLNEYSFDAPQNSVSQLLEIRQLILALEDGYWKKLKLKEVDNLIEACLGLFLEVKAAEKSATPGQMIQLSIEAINRSNIDIRLENIHINAIEKDAVIDAALGNNQGFSLKMPIQLPEDIALTNAYWLNEKASLGLYTVKNQQLRGLPTSPTAIGVRFDLVINDKVLGAIPIAFNKSVVYTKTDPVMGERYSPFEITPPVSVALDEKVYIFSNTVPKELAVTVGAGQKNIKGKLYLQHPENWKVEPAFFDFSLDRQGAEKVFKFTVFPPAEQAEASLLPVAELEDGSVYSKRRSIIEYDHIPTQTLFLDASAKAVRLEIKREGKYIGYLMGAGDDVPQALEQIGYHVTMLDDRDMHLNRLNTFDAVILGVRAYNTLDRMPNYQNSLMEYVKGGGTLIVQFNTSHRLKVPMNELAPYPLVVSRDRVTVEEAEVTIIAPQHIVMNKPNKITSVDFEGWVQERGLYFPNEWAEEYTPILSCHDVGEPDRKGGLLVARYGEGYYVYTGYSWFRQLPAGVAGAYRIFANMISLGNDTRP